MTTVWLIRHGESESNAGSASTDPAEIPLTARGQAQAARLAAAMPGAPALVVTSPYRRARQTAEPTLTRFPAVSREDWPVQEFTYLGDLHGRATTSAERRPHVEEYWRRADPHLSLGGAESFADVIRRAGECLTRLAARAGGPVAVFTHETFIRTIAWTLLTDGPPADHDGMRAFRRFAGGFSVPNAAVVELCFPEGAAPRLVVGAVW